MKTINKLFSVLLALVIVPAFQSCDDDEPEYTPAEKEGAAANIYFAGSSSQTIEVEPGITSFDFTVERLESEASAAATVDIEVRTNDEGVFEVPSSISFAAGETSATGTINVKSPVEGTYYNLTLCLAGGLSQYTEGNREKSFSFAVMKWEPVESNCYWVGNAVCRFFGVEQFPLKVDVERAETTTFIRFRFTSPYNSAATDGGYVGGIEKYVYYVGYPYNDPADCLSGGDYTYIINCPKGSDSKKLEADLYPVEMGIDWGYGTFTTGSIYGHISTNKASYPLGTYDVAAGVISFGANSLYVSMANYQSGGRYPCPDNAALYLSDEAYINAQPSEPDYDNDFTWNSVDEATGTFISAAVDNEWIQSVEVAEEDETLYRFPSLYADGANIVFYIDEKEQKVSAPKGQATGLTVVGGEPLYMDLKAGSFDENRVFTLKMLFYTQDADGNVATEVATVEETFKWGYTGISLADLQRGLSAADYCGDWIAPFYNLSSGAQASSYVTVSEMEDGNLAIQGLSARSDFDDTVVAEYDAESGLIFLAPQYGNDYGEEYGTILAAYNAEEGYYTLNSYLIGGITENGVLAFLNASDNEDPVNSVRFLATVDGSPYGWLQSYIPYPMEWTSADVAATRSISKLNERSSITSLDSKKVSKQTKKSFSKKMMSVKSSKNIWTSGYPLFD